MVKRIIKAFNKNQKQQKNDKHHSKTDFNFPGQTKLYKGKVRDVYTINDDQLIMIATDRISAFDHVLLQKVFHLKGRC